MTTQLHFAYGIVEARANTGRDHALLRNVELALQESRRSRWTRRIRVR